MIFNHRNGNVLFYRVDAICHPRHSAISDAYCDDIVSAVCNLVIELLSIGVHSVVVISFGEVIEFPYCRDAFVTLFAGDAGEQFFVLVGAEAEVVHAVCVPKDDEFRIVHSCGFEVA